MAFQVTDERRRQVEALAGCGLTHEQIGLVVGCSSDTLQRRFRSELDRGAAVALAAVAQNLFRIACGDGREAVVASIFYLKTRGRWRETPTEIEVSAGPGINRTQAELAEFAGRWRQAVGATIEG